MRTIKHILITGCIALAVSSCDYLDQQPYEYWQPEETFIDYNKTIQMLNSVYVSMPNDTKATIQHSSTRLQMTVLM